MARNNALDTSLTDGQLLVGSTGQPPTAATLTAGTGIAITNGAGSISIAATGGGGGTGRLLNVRYLTGSGTYTPTTGTESCYVIACGGGAGATFSVNITQANKISFGRPGASAAVGYKFYSDVSAISGASYSVGAGGAAAASTFASPGAGGNTTFSSGANLISLSGGRVNATNYSTGTASFGFGSSFQYQWIIPATTEITALSGDTCDYVIDGKYPSNVIFNTGGTSPDLPIIVDLNIAAATALSSNAPLIIRLDLNSQETINGPTPNGYGGGGNGGCAYVKAGVSPASQTGGSGSAGGPGVIIIYEYGS